MAVPEFPLFSRERLVDVRFDHVLYAEDARVGRVRVVEDALSDVVVEVRAVVVGCDGGAVVWVRGVGVEGVQVGADAVYGGKALGERGACFEGGVLQGFGVAEGGVCCGEGVHCWRGTLASGVFLVGREERGDVRCRGVLDLLVDLVLLTSRSIMAFLVGLCCVLSLERWS